jgi:hypothetical protein
MKHFKKYLSGILIVAVIIPLAFQSDINNFLNGSSGSEKIERQKKTFEQKMESIEERWQYEYDMVKNPYTGKIPHRIRQQEIEFALKQPVRTSNGEGDVMNVYSTLGPTNLGGRTRAFAYDKADPTIMHAGCVSSGMFRSTNSGANWTNVTLTGEFHNVSCIAQDPRTGSTTTWYYGTGEAIGNSASLGSFYLGNGIYKSTNNGANWFSLTATVSTLETFTSPFDVVHRIAVDSSTGNVYAACQRVIERSIDGGTTWSIVLGTFGGSTSTGLTDVVCTRTGRLYASFTGTEGTGFDGVYTSTTGASGSWTKIAGTGSGTTPAGWNAAGGYGRVVLALAPSNEDILYVLYWKGTTSSCGAPSPEAEFFKWTQSTTTWVERSAFLPDEAGCLAGNDPFAVQTGYDLVVAVKPDDENFVVIGGTNAYRSTDGFASTGATTRIGGYASAGSYSLYAGHHPDIHTFAFHPTTSTTMVCGDDGGIQRTASITASPVVWSSLNNEYTTYQYYHIALTPVIGSVLSIGGTQDNGTTYNSTGTPTHISIFGGDGVSVGISAGNTHHYVGFQLGPIYRRLSGAAPSTGTDIKPTGSGSGLFVTKFFLDPDNTAFLYYASGASLYRTTSATTVTPGTWTLMTGISATISGTLGAGSIQSFATTRGPYTGASKLYLGTTGGKIFRVDDPAIVPAAFVPTEITAPPLPGAGTMSGIAVDPTDGKKVMCVYAPYGIVSIFYTADATAMPTPTWTAVEGSLGLPSIRSCAIVNRLSLPTEYYVGTSVGLYSTTALAGGGTIWSLEGPGSVKLSVVSGLALRPTDNAFLVGTHGNGLFFTYVPDPLPVTLTSFSASVNKRDVTLNWVTSEEINNSGFDIERARFTLSGDEVWSKVGFVTGKGTTNEQQNYKFDDKNLSSATYKYRLKQIDYNGNHEYHNLPNDVVVGTPNVFEMSQNYPNPSNPKSKIDFSIPLSGRITLKVYDITGREVAKLVDGVMDAGYHTVNFDGTNLASGIYFYRIIAEGNEQNFNKTLKMVLVK